MGSRLPRKSLIARTAALYLCVFVCVLAALSIGAYEFVAREYASLLAPALSTPEGTGALRRAMLPVAFTIGEIDAPLVILVAIASYFLARAAIAPLVAARERERRFSADAAHELRSPLTAIAAVAQAARADATEHSRVSFETIARSALEASAVVADLLTLARDPARRALQCEPVDLAAIVTLASRDTQPVADARSVRLDVAPASAIVDGDERRLRELCVNLLDNAIRHAHQAVRISSRRAGRLCEIVVEDDGDGIPPSERERVFERFYRRVNDGAGTGLGLPIVRWIAHAHGGAVEVDRSSNGGARFVAAFPARES
jgi:signal transduction histidine kinase